MNRSLDQFPTPDELVDPREALEAVPKSLEAEQAVLGSVMFENGALADLDGIVTAESFSEPFHQRLYAEIHRLVGVGRLAEPTILSESLASDPAFPEFGGLRYLADLVDRAPPTAAAADFARIVRETWQRREMIALAGEMMRRARVDRGVDSLSILDEAEKGLLAIQTRSRTTVLSTAEDAVARVIQELENPEIAAGVKIGLPPLDEEIGGFMPGELWVLAGRPSMGKSAIASTGALHVARHGLHPDGRRLGWIEINGEMTVAQMMRRHISDLAFELSTRHAPAYSKVRKRFLTDNERACFYAAAQEIRTLPTWRGVKRTGMTLSNLRSLIRRQAAAWEREGIALGGVSIDHGGLIRVEDARRGRTEAQTEIAIGCKELADELGIPLLVLLQLNRQVEARDDKHPMLSDLRDSGAWEENADGVIGVYRDAYYAARETEPKKLEARMLWEERKTSKVVEAILLKIREGEAGTIKLWADMARNAIRGSAPDNLYGDPSAAFDFAARDGAADARQMAAGVAPDAFSDPAWSDSNPAVSAVLDAVAPLEGDPRPEPPPFDPDEFA